MAQVFGTRRQILAAFTNRFKDRPDTTFGTVNADVLEHFVPGFRRTDFVEVINRTPGRSSENCLTGLTTRQ
jgi:hypothetical protein